MKKLLILNLLFVFGTFHAQTPQIKWWYDLDDSAFGSAAASDVDNDGKYEIAFGCYRNDGHVYVLNAEDGSLVWKKNLAGAAEGCNDVAMLFYDIDKNGSIELVVPSSCNPKTFCFNGETGEVIWETRLHGSDSPPTVSDVDNDGKPEILHGNFGGSVSCLNAEDGSVAWDLMVDPNSWIQTAPTILDADNDGDLDFFVANSSFGTDHKFYCYRAKDQKLLWETDLPDEQMYHGAAVADLDEDGFQELVIGSYDGQIYAINAEDGSLLWSYAFPVSFYTMTAISIADLNLDQRYEIVFFDYDRVGVLSHSGDLIWSYEIPNFGQSFRGAAIADMNGNGVLDIVFGSTNGHLYALSGDKGSIIWDIDLGAHYGGVHQFELDHGPLIADFDQDGFLDVFIVGGHTTFPDFQENYGRAYLVSTNSTGGPEWLMFRRDTLRSGHVPIDLPTSSSTESSSSNFFHVFPNPAKDFLSIKFSENTRWKELLIYDAVGVLVKSYKLNGLTQFNLPLNQLDNGVYYLSGLAEEGVFLNSFVKID